MFHRRYCAMEGGLFVVKGDFGAVRGGYVSWKANLFVVNGEYVL